MTLPMQHIPVPPIECIDECGNILLLDTDPVALKDAQQALSGLGLGQTAQEASVKRYPISVVVRRPEKAIRW